MYNMMRAVTDPISAQAYAAVVPFPLAGEGMRLAIQTTPRGLSAIDFLYPGDVTPLLPPHSALAETVVGQLENYFRDPQWHFDLPLDLRGTAYQRRVWHALREVPAAHTLSYGQLARQLHSAARAVGQACRRNPVPLVVPCHRIVSSQGIGGFGGAVAGPTLNIKQVLLAHEAGPHG
jgi:methylated-DNA-[protein]-cysteine S-methyltransferase